MEDETEEVIAAVKFSPWVVLMAMSSAVQSAAEILTASFAMHINYEIQRDNVANEMGRELNTLLELTYEPITEEDEEDD